jgi:Tol biopolymer transport system component
MHRPRVPGSSLIVLVSAIGLAGLYSPRAGAQQAQPAAPPAAVDTLPRFAADGKHIIFQTTRDDGTPHQHVIGIDGTNEHAMTTGPVGALSPDGRTVIYQSRPTGRPAPGQMPRFQLLSARADGSGEARVFSDLPMSQTPEWSPDGHAVAFIALTGPPPQGGRPDLAIYVVDADGANRRRLRPDQPHPYEIQPDWSPDGTHIAFVTVTSADTTRGEPALAVAASDGTMFHVLGVRGESPRWSPDGRSILYWSERGKNAAIYVVGTDGARERQLTSSVGHDEVPRWSPDGRAITFQSDREGPMTIFVMNADGTGVRRVRPR